MYTIELGQDLDMTYQSEGIESPYPLHILPLIHPPTIYLLTLCPIVWPFLLIVIVCPRVYVWVCQEVFHAERKKVGSNIRPFIFGGGGLLFSWSISHGTMHPSTLGWEPSVRPSPINPRSYYPLPFISGAVFFIEYMQRRRNLFAIVRKGVGGNCSFDKYKKDNRNGSKSVRVRRDHLRR